MTIAGRVTTSSRIGLGSSFQPTQLPGCVLWLRADMGVSQVTGSVSSWADQSLAGSAPLTNAVGANQPTLISADASFNSQSTILFNGSQWLKQATLAVAQPVTVYITQKTSGAGQQISFNAAVAASIIGPYWDGTEWAGQSGTAVVTSTNTNKGPVVAAYVAAGPAGAIYVNDSQNPVGTGNGGASSLNGALIGVYQNLLSFGWVGQVAEIIVYAGLHTITQRNAIFSYMGTRYSIVVNA